MEGRSLKLYDRQTVASKGGAMNKIRLQELILFLRTFCFMNLIQTRLKVMMIFLFFFSSNALVTKGLHSYLQMPI